VFFFAVQIYPEGTLTTAGFSKWCSAGGWRVGYIIFPKAMEAMTAVLQSAASQTYSCAPAPMQYALAKVRQIQDVLLQV
jgi:aspartate aminotransferase